MKYGNASVSPAAARYDEKGSYMEKVFGQEGLSASYLKGYEYRPGQVRMAEAVLRAFEEKKHLVVEAGTGTGKTLA